MARDELTERGSCADWGVIRLHLGHCVDPASVVRLKGISAQPQLINLLLDLDLIQGTRLDLAIITVVWNGQNSLRMTPYM